MKITLTIDKFGKNDIGMWCLGTLSFGSIEYHGLFNLDKEYVLNEKGTYDVSSITSRKTKRNNLLIIVALK